MRQPGIDWSQGDWSVTAVWTGLLLFVVAGVTMGIEAPFTIPMLVLDAGLLVAVVLIGVRRRNWGLLIAGGLCLLPLPLVALALLSCGFGTGACL
ncbi:hypothetical protein [Novosphingobium sp.]|uniref:hypothetical protein n=1 Tax=Novosphingobium sp. TaxID=1874826 RepID=UPI0031E3FFF0